MSLSTDETETAVVDAGPTKTLGDLRAFVEQTLAGTALDAEEATEPTDDEPDAAIAGVFIQTAGHLTTELLLGHGEHLPAAIGDVLYGLVGIAVEFKIDIEQVVDATVREYERRAEASRQQQAFMAEFLQALAGPQIEGDSGSLEL